MNEPRQMKSEQTQSQVLYERLMLRDGFCCRICLAGGMLKCFSRVENPETLNNLLALCEECYKLAQVRMQKRMQKKMLLRLVALAFLWWIAVMGVVALSFLLPPPLFGLSTIAIYAVLLLERLTKRWL